MFCLHEWSVWSDPYKVIVHMIDLTYDKEYDVDQFKQDKYCLKCKKVKKRKVKK